jgi:hypothetical protein
MTAPPKDFDILTAKLERAEEHIFKLKEFWNGFVVDAYPLLSQATADGSYRMYYLGDVKPIPADVPLIMGDVIHNLRSSLDHLAYRLVCVGTDSAGPFERVYFPIGERPKEFKARIRAIKKCLKPPAVKALSAIEAYEGGNGDILWQLHQLDIIDKHRLLLTVYSQNRFRSMSPTEVAKMRSLLKAKGGPEIHDAHLFLKSSNVTHISLETGRILDIIPISQVQQNMQFPVEVAFAEPEVLKGKPVIELLQQAAKLIRDIFRMFDDGGLFD